MSTVSDSVCRQEIPETEGKLRELDVQNAVSQIIRGSISLPGQMGAANSRLTKAPAVSRKQWNQWTYTILLSSPYSLVCGCIDFIQISTLSYLDTVTWLTGN